MDRIEQILQAAQRARVETSGRSKLDDGFEEAASLAAELVGGVPSMPSPATSSRNESQPWPWTAVKQEDLGYGNGNGNGAERARHVAEPSKPIMYPAPASSAYAPLNTPYAPTTSAPGGVGFGKLHFAGIDLGEISSFNGIPYFSNGGLDWIRERCGTEPSFESIFALAGMSLGSSSGSSPDSNLNMASGESASEFDNSVRILPIDGQLWQTRPDGWFAEKGHLSIGNMPAVLQTLPAVDLPERSLLERCVQLFRQSGIGITIPIIDPTLFATTIDVAYSYYQPEDSQEGSASAGTTSHDDRSESASRSPETEDEGGSPWQQRRRQRQSGEYRTREGMEAICAKACIFAFMSLMAIIQVDKDESLPPIDGDAYASAGLFMITEFLPAASVVSVETTMMLSTYHMFTGQLQGATQLHTSAVRVLFILGGHTTHGSGFMEEDDPSTTPPNLNGMHISETTERKDDAPPKGPETPQARLRRHMRNLYRVCYMLDKELALRTGHPPAMDDDYCDLALLERSWSVDTQGLQLDKRLPAGNASYTKYNLTLREEISFKEKLEPSRMRLFILKSRVSKLLYSVASLRKSDAQLLRDIRELDDELDRWRSSLPPQHRPMLVVPVKARGWVRRRGSTQASSPAGSRAATIASRAASPMAPSPQQQATPQGGSSGLHTSQVGDSPSTLWSRFKPGETSTAWSAAQNDEDRNGNYNHGNYYHHHHNHSQDDSDSDEIRGKDKNRRHSDDVIMHFEYHYLMATIHRASGRCRAWKQGGEMAGLNSSQALAVQASRSTLLYMRTAVRNMHGMGFWMLFFYPMAAILTIFCNVLIRPLDGSAEEDIQLLGSVEDLIREMRQRRQLTPNEIVHVETIDQFVAELTRLSRCAVAKAEREAAFQQRQQQQEQQQQQQKQQQQAQLGSGVVEATGFVTPSAVPVGMNS